MTLIGPASAIGVSAVYEHDRRAVVNGSYLWVRSYCDCWGGRHIDRGGKTYVIAEAGRGYEWFRGECERIWLDELVRVDNWCPVRERHDGRCPNCLRAALKSAPTATGSQLSRYAWASEISEHYDAIAAKNHGVVTTQVHVARGDQAELPKASGVYLLPKDGLLKIGHSANMRNRLRTLNGQGCPVRLFDDVIGWIACEDCQAVESDLHSVFHGQRVQGEWFRASLTDIASAMGVVNARRSSRSGTYECLAAAA